MPPLTDAAAPAPTGPGAAPGTKPKPRRRSTVLGAVVLLLIALVLASALSLTIGAQPIALGTVFDALVARNDSLEHAIIWDGRIPRTMLAIVAGIAFGVAGALMQALSRNPLADPGVLGVNAGAALAIVIAAGFLGVGSITGFVWFAFAGALIVSALVYLIGTAGRRVDPVRLTLTGVALGSVLTGVGSGIALLRPEAFDRLRGWTIGTVDVRTMQPTWTILPFVLIGLVAALLASRGLNAVALGDDLAAALGVGILRTRAASIMAITLLAGSATAAAGSIAFVGLMVPHAARWITGPDQRWIIALSALVGPVLMLVSDVIGRVATAGELPVGIVTAFVGAPMLIALARRRKVVNL